MTLKHIEKYSRYSTEYLNMMSEDPEAFKLLMNSIFYANISFFASSLLGIAWLIASKQENFILYILCSFALVFYTKVLTSYRGYFNSYLNYFRLSCEILERISKMDDEQANELLSKVMSKEEKNKFLEKRKTINKSKNERTKNEEI
jgi:hypothetical protein